MLVLSEQQVQSLIDIDELIVALEQAHVQYSTGKAVMPVRLVVPLPQIQGRITSMPGFLIQDKALGMKVVTYFQDNPKNNLPAILATFPQDAPMRKAVARCHGLRLLRQEPWECLASFILSSTKQITQIRQIVARLCERHGRLIAGWDSEPAFAFPTPEQITALTEAQLRDCKMGFRAPYLLAAARRVANGMLNLGELCRLESPEARARLLELPGVGPKIADCVLLFACGFPTAFPVDVWVMRALRRSYFRNRRVPLARLREFSATHFGPYGGYAQQYLFHSLRLDEVPGSQRALNP